MSIVRRVLPIPLFCINMYDIAQVEAYLAHMAERGLFLKKIILFGIFERGKGEKTKYHVEPIGEAEGKPTEELLLQFEAAGWEYICVISNIFYVFKAVGAETKGIPGNATVVEMGLNKARARCRTRLVYSLLYFLMSTGFFVYFCFFNEDFFYQAIKNRCLLFIFGTSIFGYNAIREYKNMRMLQRYLKIGGKNSQEGAYIPNYKVCFCNIVSVLLWLFACFILIYSHLASWEMNLADYHGEKPVISLSTIETNPNLQLENSFIPKEFSKNTISYAWTELAPEIYEIQESGVIEGQTWKESTGVYDPEIDTKVYKLRFQFLVSPFLKETVKSQMDLFSFQHIQCKVIEDTKFDQAYYCFSDGYQCIFASVGKKVICVYYYGYEDLYKYSEEIYEKLNAFE